MEFVVGLVALVLGWVALKEVFRILGERARLWAKSSETDLQQSYSEILQKIEQTKARQNGKWFSLEDVQNAMKSDS